MGGMDWPLVPLCEMGERMQGVPEELARRLMSVDRLVREMGVESEAPAWYVQLRSALDGGE